MSEASIPNYKGMAEWRNDGDTGTAVIPSSRHPVIPSSRHPVIPQLLPHGVHRPPDILRIVAPPREKGVQPAATHDWLELGQRSKLLARGLLHHLPLIDS